MCVIDSATGNRKKVRPAETKPFRAPHRQRTPISAIGQPLDSPSASAPVKYPPAMISTGA